MLIAPTLPNGLEIALEGKVTSVPYIKMTLSLLNEAGIQGTFSGNVIKILPQEKVSERLITVESDWSSASYFYSFIALAKEGSVTIGSYKEESYQGDAILTTIYQKLGVETTFQNNTITLNKGNISEEIEKNGLTYDLSNAPDIAQTIVVTCFGLGITCHLTGLHTLKIKETDRLEALKSEIEKLGGTVAITENSLSLAKAKKYNKEVKIATYHDHRMAMAFAPLALRTSLLIEDAEVVTKSYPDFWSDIKAIGVSVDEI